MTNTLITPDQARPKRPSIGELLTMWRRLFRSRWSWTTGLLVPATGGVLVLAINRDDLSWLGALTTAAVGLFVVVIQAGVEPTRAFRKWIVTSRQFDSKPARVTRLSQAITERDSYCSLADATLRAIDREEASIRAYVTFPQYGDLRPMTEDYHVIRSNLAMLGIDLTQTQRDDAPALEDEPSLATFLVRGESGGSSPVFPGYSQEHRDSQRLWKRQIFRQEIASIRRWRSDLLEKRDQRSEESRTATAMLAALQA